MLSITLNVNDKRTYPGIRIAEEYEEVGEDLQEEFAKYMAKVLRNEFKKAIDKQRYRRKWPPLSITYLRYKEKHHLSLKMWKATGLLQKSIVYRKRNGYYLVGIDPYKRYRNGPKVLEIAKCLEYGTTRMPARPLFRPIFEYTRKHIRTYWNKFLKSKHIKINEEGR